MNIKKWSTISDSKETYSSGSSSPSTEGESSVSIYLCCWESAATDDRPHDSWYSLLDFVDGSGTTRVQDQAHQFHKDQDLLDPPESTVQRIYYF